MEHLRSPRGIVERIPPALWLAAGLIVLRVAAAAAVPLIDDEAYYWLWAQRPAWGYLDHPPAIAWLVALTTSVGDSAFLIRLGPLVLGIATTYTIFLLGREMFGLRAGTAAAVLFQVVPVLAGAGLLATPDAPLLLCWIVALRLAWQALHGHPGRWLGAGAVVGVGLLSKAPMILLLLGLALYVATRATGSLRHWQVYAGAALAAVMLSPVLLWNAQHGWAGLEFVWSNRLTAQAAAWSGLTGVGKLLEEQMPFALALLPAYVWALVVPLRRRDEPLTFLALTALPAVIFPFIPAYTGAAPHGNWLAPAYLSFSLVLGAAWNGPVAGLAAVNGAAVCWAMMASFLPALPLPPGTDGVYGWREAGVRARHELTGLGSGAGIAADRYQIAAQLAYHARIGGRPAAATVLPCPRRGSVWESPQWYAGGSAVAVIDARWEPAVRWGQYAARVEELPALTVRVRGAEPRRFRVFRLLGLRPPECPAR